MLMLSRLHTVQKSHHSQQQKSVLLYQNQMNKKMHFHQSRAKKAHGFSATSQDPTSYVALITA